MSENGAAPGECYWYQKSFYKTGILLHLSAILPCALLAIFQFIPAIRYRFMIFHRMSGYIIITLTLIANAGAIMVARRAFGGTLSTQTFVGLLALMSTLAILNAYYNIKRLQLDQHRAWMLRTFAWMASIVTSRIIQLCMMRIIGIMPAGYDFWDQRSCAELMSIAGPHATYHFYPTCEPSNPNFINDGRVVMHASNGIDNPFEKIAAAGISFPAALWLSLALHVLGIELFLQWTSKEASRLRTVSYERQTERGFKNPGSAGLVAERFGDMDPWTPTIINLVNEEMNIGNGSEVDMERGSQQNQSIVDGPAPGRSVELLVSKVSRVET